MSWAPELIAGLRDVSIVVFLGYGLKLVKQQNELLEREKALKQAEIDVHEAHIKRLETLQAPAIARDLDVMTLTADQYAEKKQKLETQVQILVKENQASQTMVDMSNIVGIAAGSMEAWALISRTREWVGVQGALSGTSPSDNFIARMLDGNLAALAKIIDQAFEGQKPELRHVKDRLAEKRAVSAKGV